MGFFSGNDDDHLGLMIKYRDSILNTKTK